MASGDYDLDLLKLIDLDCLHPSMRRWIQEIVSSRACQKSQSEDFCNIQPWRNK